MGITSKINNFLNKKISQYQPGVAEKNTSFKGSVVTAKQRLSNDLIGRMQVSLELKAIIEDIKFYDQVDGRVKDILDTCAEDMTRGGLVLHFETEENAKILQAFKDYKKLTGFANTAKLYSYARQFLVQGALYIQWTYNESGLVGAHAMPVDDIIPNASHNGVFNDTSKAFVQYDYMGNIIESWDFKELSYVRLNPFNIDNIADPGRPLLDAARDPLLKLRMTDEDLVIRRKSCATSTTVHSIQEDAKDSALEDYKKQFEDNQDEVIKNVFSNKEVKIETIQGDPNLDAINDVNYLENTFYAACPGPKAVFADPAGIQRDTLEHLLKSYYKKIDTYQEILSSGIAEGFYWYCLHQGILPDKYDFSIDFAERRTESRNQQADLALKYLAMGADAYTVFKSAGLDPNAVMARRKVQDKELATLMDYGDSSTTEPKNKVTVVENNAHNGESQTSVAH